MKVKFAIVATILVVIFGATEITAFYTQKAIDEETARQNAIKVEEIVSHKKEYVKRDVEELKIPILMYHSISDLDPNNGLLVPIKQFEEQMNFLKENGYTTMLLDEVVQAFETGLVPEKPIAVTFDDGYMDNYTAAYPILKNNNQKATFFIITKGIDSGYYMGKSELLEMKSYGMGIENHTYDHREMNKLSYEEQMKSISTGKNDLYDKLGIENKFFCYPVGRFNNDTLSVLNELGITAAVTTRGGVANKADGMLTLDRVRIAPMTIDTFKSKIEGN